MSPHPRSKRTRLLSVNPEPAFVQNELSTSARPGSEGVGSFVETLTQDKLVHLNQVRLISDLRWLTGDWYVNTFNRLMLSWQPRKVRVTLGHLDRDLCTRPLWAYGTSIWLPELDSLNGAMCAPLNTASKTGTEEFEFEFVARVTWWFADLEQCAENLRIDRQYLNHAPGWSMTRERQTFEVAPQSKSGLDVGTNSFIWRRATSQAANGPADDAGGHQEPSDLSEPDV